MRIGCVPMKRALLVRKVQFIPAFAKVVTGLEVRIAAAAKQSDELKEKLQEAKVKDAEKREKLVPYFEARRSLENAQRILDTIFMRILAEKVDAQIPRQAAPPKNQ